MKQAIKFSILLVLLIFSGLPSRQQDVTLSDVSGALSSVTAMLTQIQSVTNGFKNSQRYVRFGQELGEVVSYSNRVNQKYYASLSANQYLKNSNYTNFFRVLNDNVTRDITNSTDYQNKINSSLQVCDYMISAMNGQVSGLKGIMQTAQAGLSIAALISSSGLSSLFGGGSKNSSSAQQNQPDPQKVIDNIKVNDDWLDKAYGDLASAKSKLILMDGQLDGLQKLQTTENEFKARSNFYIM